MPPPCACPQLETFRVCLLTGEETARIPILAVREGIRYSQYCWLGARSTSSKPLKPLNQLMEWDQPLKRIAPVRIEAHEFAPRDFVGGYAALDFANTVTGRNRTPRDWLDSYERLADWASMCGLISPRLAAKLKRRAGTNRQTADAALAEAKSFREALHSYFAAVAARRRPPKPAIARIHSAWVRSSSSHIPRIDGGRLFLDLDERRDDLSLILDRLAHQAIELARTVEPARLRICDGDNCGWLFLDLSKGGRRRWCDMATCGNAAKARRYQERKALQ